MAGTCHDCEEGIAEWVMSYADMITILMAFFVVMYSMAGAPKDKNKEEAVMRSLRERFGPLWPGIAALGPGPYVPKDSALGKMASAGGAKSSNRKSGGADQRASLGDYPRVHTLHPGQQAMVGAVLFFPEGSADLTPDAVKQLKQAEEQISGKPQKIEIRGHTSRRPVPKGSPFRDNWDLAYARCHHTMEQLVAMGIDPKRLRLSVAADNEPIGARIDPLARSQNSRVEVSMLNEVTDPGPAHAGEAFPGLFRPPTKADASPEGSNADLP